MKIISWQLVVIIVVVVLCVAGVEIYALSKGINGTGLAIAVSGMVGIPAVIVTRKFSKPKIK